MGNLAVTHAGGGRARAALATAVLSLLLFIGGGFTVGGSFWLLGAAAGLGAVVLGVAASRSGGGREATMAVILGSVPVVWFAAYMIVEALG